MSLWIVAAAWIGISLLIFGFVLFLAHRFRDDPEIELDRNPLAWLLMIVVTPLVLVALVLALLLSPIIGLVQFLGIAYWRSREAVTARFEADGIAILRGGKILRKVGWTELESWTPEHLSAPPRYVHHLKLSDGEHWTADFVEGQHGERSCAT